ncbi:hypothetical protein D3C80_2158640 [compost metagenome]
MSSSLRLIPSFFANWKPVFTPISFSSQTAGIFSDFVIAVLMLIVEEYPCRLFGQ